MEELIFLLFTLGYAGFGAFVRATYGIYRAYSNYDKFTLSKKRIAVEFFASVVFGLFGAIILNEVGFWKIGINIIAILAGLIGADLINILARRFGLRKNLEVNIVEKTEYPDLNIDQQRAMEFLKKKRKLTAEIYRRLNETATGRTKWELSQMVEKGYLKKVGKGKATFYTLARKTNNYLN